MIRQWTNGVPVEPEALAQVSRVDSLPFVHGVALMPDVHVGIGATVGSVIATTKAIIPAAVGVDIGCGMVAVKTPWVASDLPDSLALMRSFIEQAVPHGRTDNGGPNDRGAWYEPVYTETWGVLAPIFKVLCDKHPALAKSNHARHLGTLGTGNHFIEVCLDEAQHVWVMLHSGSRGVGGRIGSYFIAAAKEEMKRFNIHMPDKDLAYLSEGSELFQDYVLAVTWAQMFASANRALMLDTVLTEMMRLLPEKPGALETAVNCHHNYVSWETFDGQELIITRKGAVSAKKDQLGIIPGSMGAKSYIVRGLGNASSYNSCSHGAGRVMSRTAAKKVISLEDHLLATAGVECRKDADVLDESPAAYKDIDAVMAAQTDLVEIVHTLKQVLCIKG